MNKNDIINEVAKVVQTKKEAQAAVESILSSITDALRKGETVTVSGFGTFKVQKRAARTGRNPKTGAPIEITAANVPRFIPGKAIKDAVNM